MNYHVFIVDKNTFKYHLECMFAGTGAGDKKVPFLLNCTETSTHSTTERNLVGMIADVSRIRIGDKIVFYLQSYNGNSGMFYGVFKASSKAFFDENDSDNYLNGRLGKSLTFRINIDPDCVYPLGISEHEYLDSLDGVQYSYQMCWSLIYRKLKGNRGCTTITKHEFDCLLTKLNSINNNGLKGNSFTYDSSSMTIKQNSIATAYTGRTDSIDIEQRMIFKANRRNAFEVHLQAYIMQNFDKRPLNILLLPLPELNDYWVGNEVSCGVGMQRIDITIVQEKSNDVYIKIIELKCVEPYMSILTRQLQWYIQWVMDYIVPNYTVLGKTVHIIPCTFAKSTTDINFINGCKNFKYNGIIGKNIVVEPAEYIGFDITNNNITFQKIV